MAFGLFIAAVSTVMQSAAFVFSRRFVVRFGSPVELVIYSQLWMGIMGAAAFAASIWGTTIPLRPLLPQSPPDNRHRTPGPP